MTVSQASLNVNFKVNFKNRKSRTVENGIIQLIHGLLIIFMIISNLNLSFGRLPKESRT